MDAGLIGRSPRTQFDRLSRRRSVDPTSACKCGWPGGGGEEAKAFRERLQLHAGICSRDCKCMSGACRL